MRTRTKLATYGAVLVIVLGGGAGLGAAAGPIDVGSTESGEAAHSTPAGGDPTPVELPGGLAAAQDGYRLVAESGTLAPGAPTEWRFRIVDAVGAPVTAYDEENERDLHLIVVDRNLVDYAHLHPTLDHSGTWSVELPALASGSYRAFADFRPTGAEALTLGVDLAVTGPVPGDDLPAPSDRDVVDGYEVSVEGEPRPGDSELAFTVRLDGEAVHTDPYLGSAGHLVAIRAGDLAYLHVHPVEGEGDEVRFAAEFPSAGTYRLFLDFSHGGEVRTAAFTVTVPDATAVDGGSTQGPHAGAQDEGH